MKQVREDIKDQSDMNPFDSLITQVATDPNLDYQVSVNMSEIAEMFQQFYVIISRVEMMTVTLNFIQQEYVNATHT